MDVEQNQGLSYLCYLGVLMFIPFFMRRESDFIRFHSNQGLLCLLIDLFAGFVFLFKPFRIISALLGLALVVFKIIGMVNCHAGEKARLPAIGKYDIIK